MSLNAAESPKDAAEAAISQSTPTLFVFVLPSLILISNYISNRWEAPHFQSNYIRSVTADLCTLSQPSVNIDKKKNFFFLYLSGWDHVLKKSPTYSGSLGIVFISFQN